MEQYNYHTNNMVLHIYIPQYLETWIPGQPELHKTMSQIKKVSSYAGTINNCIKVQLPY